MSTVTTDVDEQPRPSDLLIREQQPLHILQSTDPGGDGVFNADGTVDIVIARPCAGRGSAGHIFEAAMLEREHPKMRGLSIFVNHDSPVARKARAGLPRSPSELGGVIRETYFDPAFTTPDDAKFDYGPGAPIGRCVLTDEMEALVRKIPEAVKASMNMQATGVHRGDWNGKKGWVVEGFEDDKETQSFDLVTAAGAGGRVRSVLEALHNPADDLPFGDEELDMSGMTVQEALETPEVKGHIELKIQEGLAAQAAAQAISIQEAVTAAVEETRASIRDEVRDELGQDAKWGRLNAAALKIIESLKLPASAKDKLRHDYRLIEGHSDDDPVTPAPALSIIEAVMDGDIVTKPAKDVLREAIEEDAKALRLILREALPTVPFTPGGGGEDGAPPAAKFGGENAAWVKHCRDHGMDPSRFGAPAPVTAT